jgi:hypothetical protein
MKEGYVIPALAGYLSFVVLKFWKNITASNNKEAFNEDYSDLSEGQKIKGMVAKIVDTHTFEGYYGTTNIYTMRGEDGRKYKWFTQKEFDNNTTLKITSCSIKKLEDDVTYGKSIVLTRCYAKEMK